MGFPSLGWGFFYSAPCPLPLPLPLHSIQKILKSTEDERKVPNQALIFRTVVLRNRLRGSSTAYVSRSPLVMFSRKTSTSPLLRPFGLDGVLRDKSRSEGLCRCPMTRAGAGIGASTLARALARAPMRPRMSTSPYTGGPHISIILSRS